MQDMQEEMRELWKKRKCPGDACVLFGACRTFFSLRPSCCLMIPGASGALGFLLAVNVVFGWQCDVASCQRCQAATCPRRSLSSRSWKTVENAGQFGWKAGCGEALIKLGQNRPYTFLILYIFLYNKLNIIYIIYRLKLTGWRTFVWTCVFCCTCPHSF